ncbi:MAG: rod-binding protein [Rhodospirillales bacterium]|nr:rod-binding protein [Rhodospirillales bacterium]
METTALQMDASTALGTAQANALPRVPKTKDIEQLRKTAQEFEAIYLSQMLKPMFEGIQAEEPFGGGNAEDMYRSLMIDEYGKSLAKSGGIGIADQVMREMLKMQEVN